MRWITAIFVLLSPGLALGGQPDHTPRIELVIDRHRRSSAREPKVTSPFGVSFDSMGTLYFVEMVGNRVRKLGTDGVVTTLAGTGQKGDGGDGGPAVQAELNGPHSLAVLANGDIFVADTWNNRVRKIEARSGRITNVAGTGQKGFSGDGGPATKATFGGIYCLALDETNQTLDLADLDNRRVRRVDLKTGIVTTVAGNGKKGVPADGADARSAAARRSEGRRDRWPWQPLHPRARRACASRRRSFGKDPHGRWHRQTGRLRRWRRRPSTQRSTARSTSASTTTETC